jgi:AraC-like DNA-binding protein
MSESLDIVTRLTAATGGRIEGIVSTFERLTGLQVCFLFKSRVEHNSDYKAGNFLRRVGHRSEFCTLIKAAPNSPGCKFYDHEVRMQKAEELGQPFVDRCPAGAVELVLPFYIHGRFIGAYFCGQITEYDDPAEAFEDIWQRVKARGVRRDRLQRAWSNVKPMNRDHLLEAGRLLLFALTHVADTLSDSVTERSIYLRSNPFIRKVLLLVHYGQNGIPSLKEAAGQLDISPEYLSRTFKKVMKKSYVEYVTEIRMSKAQELLKNTDLPITDIAFEVGYQTHSYFTSLYRKMTGITPRQFRDSVGNVVRPRRVVRSGD